MDSRELTTAARRLFVAVAAPSCLLAASAANAVEPTVYQLGDGGAVAPHVRLDIGSDNNPLRAEEGSEGSLYLRLQPSASYLLQRRNNRLTFGYNGDFYQYFEEYCLGQIAGARPGDCSQGSPSFDTASYQDHRLSLDGFLEVTSRLRLTANLFHEIDHQPLGTGLSANQGVLAALTTPENWARTTARAEVAYGAFQARGELRAGLSLTNRDFNSERNVDLDTQSDTSIAPFVQLLYRVGTRTQLFARLGADRVRDSVSFNPDGTVFRSFERDITRIGFGAELDDSSVTSGRVSLSAVREDFLFGGSDRDLQFVAFDASLIWRPRRFSTVTLTGGRETGSGVTSENLSLSTSIDADWVHFWRDQFSTRVQVGFVTSDDVDDPDVNIAFEDDIFTFRFEGNYNIRRWLDIGGFLRIDSRDGRGDTRDFERTLIGITANGTI